MPTCDLNGPRYRPPGHRPWLRRWRYPGTPIPWRLRSRYEVKP